MRDRIIDLRRVPASDLLRNPRNFRLHPEVQERGIAAALARIGFADAVIARELPDKRLQIIDGHLRAEVSGDATVPVLVTDLSEIEANEVLGTLDPLAAMAEIDTEKLQALINEIDASDDEAFSDLLQEVEALWPSESESNNGQLDAHSPGRADEDEGSRIVVSCPPGERAHVMNLVSAAVAGVDGAYVSYGS